MSLKPSRPKPERIGGAAHVLAAASYSLGGLKRLLRETAFRQELLLVCAGLLLLVALGATIVEYLLLIGIFLLLVAVEALNTAIECIVDRLSPEWEEYARDAKDLGSLAVMCILLCGGLFILYVILSRIFT